MRHAIEHLIAILYRLGSLGTLASDSSMSDGPFRPDSEAASKNAKTGKIAIGIVVGMFLFGFASIPMYRWVCAQTDPGGSSWFIGEPDVYEDVEVDEQRNLTVNFRTNVDRQLPWQFDVETSQVDINPGEQTIVDFSAANTAIDDTTGKAIYDISPPEAAPHFKKTECFCFIEQTLSAGDDVEFPLVFWFDSDLPEHVDEIDLGYTFFNAQSSRARAAANE